MSRARRPKPYAQKQGNVYLLQKRPPTIREPNESVKAQILEFEKRDVKTLTLDREGRVHQVDVDPIDLYVASEGARAASWLVFQHRARFHRAGYVDFQIPTDKETPMWFRVAFVYIQRRSRSFFAYMERRENLRHYVVRWEKWNTYKPKALALALLRPPANQ